MKGLTPWPTGAEVVAWRWVEWPEGRASVAAAPPHQPDFSTSTAASQLEVVMMGVMVWLELLDG